MEDEPCIPQEKETLKTFYADLISGIRQTSKFVTYQRPFKFAHDILTRNKITDDVDFSICAIISFVNNLFTVLLCYPVELLSHLVPPSVLSVPDTAFYQRKIDVRSVSIALSLITLIVVMYPWIVFLFFDQKQLMSSKKAAICYMIFEYYPQIISSVQGYMFGAFSMATFDADSSTFIESVVWFTNGLTFILMVISYIIWKLIIKFQLSIKTGYFGTFSSPYNQLDLCVLYIVAASHPLRCTQFASYLHIVTGMMVIFGVYRLIKSRIPCFTSFVGETIYVKEAIDYIIFGIYSSICIGIGGSSFYYLTIAMLLCFLSFVCAAAYANMFHSTSSDNAMNSFDIQHTPTVISALTKVRYAVINSCNAVADIKFLNEISQYRMSVSIIPDITRICLVQDIDLDEIQMKQPPSDPLSLFSLYFLAFQVDQFYKCKLTDDSKEIQDIAEELKRSTQKVSNAIQKFWTVADDDHRCLYDMWEISNYSKRFIRKALLLYPQSSLIKRIRESYFTSTLKSTYKLSHVPHSRLAMLRNPMGTCLGFLTKEGMQETLEIEDAPVERYFADKESCAIMPIHVAAGIILVMAFLVSFFFSCYFDSYFDLVIHHLDIEIDILYATSALSNEILSNADASFTQPSYDIIMRRLGISKTEAVSMRGKFKRTTKMPLLDKLLLYVRPTDNHNISLPGCKSISFLLNLHAGGIRNPDNATRPCYIYQLNNNLNSMYPIVNEHIAERGKFINNAKTISLSVLISVLIVAAIIWISVVINLKREKNTIVQAVRRATAFNEQRCEYADKSFIDTFTPFLYYFMFSIQGVILFVVFYFTMPILEEHFSNMIQQISVMGKIGTLYEFIMTLAIFSFPQYSNNGKDKDFYINMLKSWLPNVSYLIESFINLQSKNYHIIILDDGPQKERLYMAIREFAQIIERDFFKIDGYSFLYARYVSFFDLYKIQDTVIPKMISDTRKAIQLHSVEFLLLALLMIVAACGLHYLILSYVSFNKGWIESASMIIRCRMYDDNEIVKSVLDILERRKPNYIDDFPFPVFVRRKDGAIVMCNTKVLSFTPHSKTQIVGQQIEHFFGPLGDTIQIQNREGQMVTMEVEIDSSGPSHEIVMFKDITSICDANIAYNALLEKLTPIGLELPTRGVFYIIRHRFTKPLSNEDMKSIGVLETTAKVIRIAITATSYISVAKDDADIKLLVGFISAVSKKINLENKVLPLVCTLVKGTTSILPLVGSAIPTLCGKTADRASERIINGEFGSFFIDHDLVFEGIEELASPLTVRQI